MSEPTVPSANQAEKKHTYTWSWTILWRSLAIIVAFILLTFAANMFAAALRPQIIKKAGADTVQYDPLPARPIVQETQAQVPAIDYQSIHILERSLSINSSAEELQIAFLVVVPAGEHNAAVLAEQLDDARPDVLARTLFGQLVVGNTPLLAGNFLPITWEVDPSTQTMRVTLRAAYRDINYPRQILYDTDELDFVHPDVDNLLITTSDTVVSQMKPLPDKADAREVSIVRRSGEEVPDFELKIDRVSTSTQNETNQERRLSRRAFLRKLGSYVNGLPIVSRLLFALTTATPLLLFLWQAKKMERDTEPRQLQSLIRLTMVLLIFHFGFHLTDGFERWLATLPGWSLGHGYLNHVFNQFLPISARLFGTEGWRVETVLLGVLAPGLLLLNRKSIASLPPKPWSRSQILSLVVILIACTILLEVVLQSSARFQTAQICENCGPPLWVWSYLLLLAIIGALAGGLWVILRVISGNAPASLLVYAMLFVALNAVVRTFLRPTPAGLWWWYAFILATVLLLCFGSYIYARFQELGWRWEPRGFAAIALIAGAMVLALPLRLVGSSGTIPEWEFLSFVNSLDGLLVPVWAVATLFLLHQDGKADLKLDRATLVLGGLALSAFLFSTLARWLYIPITFLLGWAALRWLLANGGDWGSIDKEFKKITKTRPELIRHGGLLRTLDQAYPQIRKDKIDKLAKGELSPSKLKKDLDTWEKEYKAISSQQSVELSPKLISHPLALGPKATAWENGQHGMLWASLFAVPWFILYIVNFMLGHSYSIEYPWLDFLIDLFTIYVRWAGIGFMLGYFFPYLRGHSGLEKGLSLALAVVLPTFPIYLILYDNAAAWQAALFWAVQVLIECILLGLLAFDYSTVREDRRGFQLLLEIHGLRSLGLWTATLIAAIGTSVVTLFSSQAASLIGLTLQTLLPDTFGGISPPR